MATLGNKFLDLIDVFKRQTDTRDIAVIIEMLSETNTILEDAIAMECNSGTKHRTTVRTGLPEVTWGQLYKGILQSKGETAQVDDTTGFAEILSTVDTRLLELSQNRGALRLSEAQGALEALNQEVASRLIYGNQSTDPEQFTGLAPRFNDLSADNAGQIVDGGGSGSDNTSIWFVTWGDQQSHLIYPQGTRAGIERQDKGEQRVLDDDGNPYFVEEELFRWHIGLTVRDWRFISRVANVDVSDLQAGSTDIMALMRQAFWKIKRHNVAGGREAIYCNADVMEALDAAVTPTSSTQATSDTVRLTPDQAEGREVMTYRGIPIRQVDAITNSEAQVT